MRFMVDAQLPPALARRRVSRGYTADHVADLGLGSVSDDVIWRHAAEIQAAMITEDEDFAFLKVLKSDGPTVIWIRLRNTRRSALIRWFDQALPDVLDALAGGETLIEIARDPTG